MEDWKIKLIMFLTSFVGGWIVGYLIAFIKKKKKEKEIPLLTPEEKEIYKLLKIHFKGLQEEIRRIEEKLG